MSPDNSNDERNVKCEPIARSIFNELSAVTANDNGQLDLDAALTAVMTRFLSEDLNLETEIPYVYQLMTGMCQKLTDAVNGMTLTGIDSTRYDAIRAKVFAVMSQGDDYSEVGKIFADENLSALEVRYILEDIFNGVNTLVSGMNDRLKGAQDTAEAKLFGITDMHALTMSILDKALGGTGEPQEATAEQQPEAKPASEEPQTPEAEQASALEEAPAEQPAEQSVDASADQSAQETPAEEQQ